MEDVIYDRLMWIPIKDLPNRSFFEQELSLIPNVARGRKEAIKLYEYSGGYFGVPRRYGRMHFRALFDRSIDCTVDNVIDDWPELTWPKGTAFREGQERAVKLLYKKLQETDGGLFVAPCGSGKTLMTLALLSLLKRPAVVLTHQETLASQWHRDAKDFFPDIRLGHVQRDTQRFENCHVVTALFQTVYRRIDSLPADFFRFGGIVIIEEGHVVPAKTFETVLRQFYARFRLAISATFRRKDGLEPVWYWHIGKKLVEAKTAQLTGNFVQVNWTTNLSETLFRTGRNLNTAAFVSAIAKNHKRNHWLTQQALDASASGRRVLILSDRTEQCDELRKLCITEGLKKNRITSVGVFYKSMNADDLELLANKEIIIATYQKMGLGVDIPKLDTLFLATPRSDIEQFAGRIRRPVEKKPILIVDIVDSTPYCRLLAAKRKKMLLDLGFHARRA
jgi:superfamily II DNA or RNA helicase